MRSKRDAVRRNGFTLVEVLVALVVTALLLTIVMNAAVAARQRAQLTAQKRDAIILSRTLLTEAAVEPYWQGSRTGVDQGLHWQVKQGPAMEDPKKRFILASIGVTVSSERGTLLFSVGTRRLKSLPAS